MHPSQIFFIGLLWFFTTLAATIEDSRPEHIQKLAKRGCDFGCKRQNECDTICYNQPYGLLMLGVCRNNKCYCGFMPPDRVY